MKIEKGILIQWLSCLLDTVTLATTIISSNVIMSFTVYIILFFMFKVHVLEIQIQDYHNGIYSRGSHIKLIIKL